MKPAKKKEATPLFIATNRGLMKCSLPEFEPSSYVGLKKNCGRKPSPKAALCIAAKKAIKAHAAK